MYTYRLLPYNDRVFLTLTWMAVDHHCHFHQKILLNDVKLRLILKVCTIQNVYYLMCTFYHLVMHMHA